MDMSSITSTIADMTMGATATVMNMATSTATDSSTTMDHSSMSDDSSMSMGGCKINMMLNYYTIDACFISEDWKITSQGMFAGSCIGVVCLAVFLEFLRRAVKEYDRLLVKQHLAKHEAASAGSGSKDSAAPASAPIPPFRPNFWQQAVRAILHTAQFTVAYFIMLLGMFLCSPPL
jgi:copper transporter 1